MMPAVSTPDGLAPRARIQPGSPTVAFFLIAALALPGALHARTSGSPAGALAPATSAFAASAPATSPTQKMQLPDTGLSARTEVDAPPSGAQAVARLQGRVLGPDGKPLAGQVVTIHRVDASGGAAIAVDTSGADGGFEAELKGAAAGAIFFASSHYKGQLYIGPPFRGPIPRDEDYVLVVGTPSTSGAALLKALEGGAATGSPSAFSAAATPAQRRNANTWFWSGLILSALLVMAGIAYTRTHRTRREITPLRRALMRLAVVEEHLAALESDDAPTRPRAEAARDRLRRDVQRLAGVDAHAAG